MIAATKPLSFARVASVARINSGLKARTAGRPMIVRSAEDSTPESPVDNKSTFFYGGKTYASEEEWKAAVASGEAAKPAPAAPTPSESQALTFGDLMAFSGPAPELINSRLAMLAFVSALFAELSSGESVVKQFADEPTGIILTAITFSIASLIPMFNNTKREDFGPFSATAEITNGRAAMLGFAALLLVEGFKGSALF